MTRNFRFADGTYRALLGQVTLECKTAPFLKCTQQAIPRLEPASGSIPDECHPESNLEPTLHYREYAGQLRRRGLQHIVGIEDRYWPTE